MAEQSVTSDFCARSGCNRQNANMPDEQYQTSEYKCKADQLRSVLDDRQRRRAAGEEFSDLSLVADHSDLMPELAEELYKRRRIEAARKQAALGSAAGDVTGDSDAVVMDELKRLLASHDRAERPTMLFASAQPDRPVQQPTRNTAVSPGRSVRQTGFATSCDTTAAAMRNRSICWRTGTGN